MSPEQHFTQYGYAVVPKLVTSSVAESLRDVAATDSSMSENVRQVRDASGRKSRLTLWYEPGDDVFGRLSCCSQLVRQMATFLGGDVSFFHAKLMQKEPTSGGSWEWHQDYGYWHRDGFPRADMGSCYVALDPATTENGCLEVIPHSHNYGLLNHGTVGEQTGADGEAVETLLSRHDIIPCELEPGDALFFHANLLHRSGANLSTMPRLGLITSFFRQDNQSTRPEPRFRNKETPLFDRDSILEGSFALEKTKSFLSK